MNQLQETKVERKSGPQPIFRRKNIPFTSCNQIDKDLGPRTHKPNEKTSNFPDSATYRTAYRARSALSRIKKGDNISEVRVEHTKEYHQFATNTTTSRKQIRRPGSSPPKTHNGVFHVKGKRKSTERIARSRKNYAPEKGFISKQFKSDKYGHNLFTHSACHLTNQTPLPIRPSAH